MRELAQVLSESLSTICHQSWLTSEVSVDRKLAKMTPIYKMGSKEDLENWDPVLALVKIHMAGGSSALRFDEVSL